MRFVFHVHGYKPAYNLGGPIHSVSALAEGLVSRGHEVFVATSNRNLMAVLDVDTECVYDVNGVSVRYFDTVPHFLQRSRVPYFAKSAAFSFGSSFARWLSCNAGRFDVFHTHLSFLSKSNLFSATASALDGVYLYSQRGCLDPLRLKFRALKKLLYIKLYEKRVMRRARALIALTEYERGVYRSFGLRQRVEVIPNGIGNFEGRSNGAVMNPVLKSFLERARGKILFTFLGRLHPIKGADIFARSFIRAARDNLDIYGVFAGPDEFEIADGVRAEVEKFGLAERFCIPGTVTGSDKELLLGNTQCFVLPTASEGLSMAILEALSAGCAVITTPGAHFDEIEKHHAGWVVERSEEGIEGAMRATISLSASELTWVGANGKRLAESKYDWGIIIDQYLELCNELRRNSVKG